MLQLTVGTIYLNVLFGDAADKEFRQKLCKFTVMIAHDIRKNKIHAKIRKGFDQFFFALSR
jgi:hypothetical protein